MSDGFDDWLDRVQAFYGDLARNNTRDWFEPRKDAWKRDIEGPAKLLAEIMAEEIARISGDAHRPKLFRIHRDVRFSKDKSPYKTMLAMLWAPPGGGDTTPAFYFGVQPAATFVGLVRYRAMVDAHGDELAGLIAASGGRLADIGPEPLKRVPKPYAPDHPHGDLLRRKALALMLPLPDDWRDAGLVPALTARIERLLPFRDLLVRQL